MNYLYQTIGHSNQGLIVTFGYRLITILIAMVGAVYYLGSRKEVADVIHDAEIEQEHEADEHDDETDTRQLAVGRRAGSHGDARSTVGMPTGGQPRAAGLGGGVY